MKTVTRNGMAVHHHHQERSIAMISTSLQRLFPIASVLISFLIVAPSVLRSHCDTMNGPVITAARSALETGNVDLVLIWVQKNDEAAIRDAFRKTLRVRSFNAESRELADRYFFETLVRIHRAGEGVAYTGIKSAETEPEEGIAAADRALATGSPDELIAHLSETVRHGLKTQFDDVMKKKNFKPNEVDKGREYVEAYVRFIHYAERLVQNASTPPEGHRMDHEGPVHDEH
jgi:hypothetical protein